MQIKPIYNKTEHYTSSIDLLGFTDDISANMELLQVSIMTKLRKQRDDIVLETC